jgi:hypothetical protein
MADCDQPAAEDGGTTWQRLATLVPGLGPTTDGPLSCAAVGVRGGEEDGGRQRSDAVEMDDGGGRKGGEE